MCQAPVRSLRAVKMPTPLKERVNLRTWFCDRQKEWFPGRGSDMWKGGEELCMFKELKYDQSSFRAVKGSGKRGIRRGLKPW